MQLFFHEKKDIVFGALIEVGSGSVVVSIVKSDPNKKHPEIIWSKREFSPFKSTKSELQDPKRIITTLLNTFLLIDSAGRKALNTFQPDAKIKTVQIVVTAPWSFTVSKNIDYKKDAGESFVVTTDLIENLIEVTEKQVAKERTENEIANNRGLTIINKATTSLTLNGYFSNSPLGQKVQALSLIQITALVHTFLVNEMLDLKNKILPKATLRQYSSVMVFHALVHELYPHINDYCLVNITYEATEVVIIRDGKLLHCTHASIGFNTLARNFAKALNIPHEEAYAFMREPNYTSTLKTLSATRRKALEKVLENFHNQLVKLLQETGDTLSIPRIVFLLGGNFTDEIIKKQLTSATTTCTKSSHSIIEITSDIISNTYSTKEKAVLLNNTPDTSILLAAQFFHKQQHNGTIIRE